jgi:hypothetical protein
VSDERGPLSFGDEPRAAGGRQRERRAGPEPPEEIWLPGPPTRDPPRPPRSRLPGIVLLVAGFLLLVVVGLNTLRTEGGSSTGLATGDQLPPFAAPLVASDLEGDVNLARERDQGAAGSRPACDIRDARVLTSCDLVADGPAVLAFFAAGEQRCVDALDDLDRALGARPDIRGAAVAVRGDRDELRRLVRAHDWKLQVVQDRDGALANVMGIAVCPQLTFLRRGGRVEESAVGELGAADLDARLDRLARPAAG